MTVKVEKMDTVLGRGPSLIRRPSNQATDIKPGQYPVWLADVAVT